MSRVLLALIRGYQLGLSPYFGRQCRFMPTCSSYAQEAIVKYGALQGSWLGLRRIARCHPWCEGGYDPVP
jgi:putative membrane protein insertion efficiency factor